MPMVNLIQNEASAQDWYFITRTVLRAINIHPQRSYYATYKDIQL